MKIVKKSVGENSKRKFCRKLAIFFGKKCVLPKNMQVFYEPYSSKA